MQTIPLSHRLRYHFDNLMAKGPIALIGWLGLISITLITVITLFVQLLGLDPDNRGFFQLAWAGLMRTLDAGTMGGDTGSWAYLFMMLTTTLGGIFIVSTLIGILSSGLEGKLDDLRKGRSFVAEQGHTVILGWSSHIFTLISELVLANASQSRACIVIMADKDVVEMQDEINSRVGSTGRTQLVYRTGNPIEIADLTILNPDAAKSIIILPPDDSNPDASVIKSILALTRNPKRSSKPYHVVTFIRDAKNLDVARMVGGNEVELLLASNLIARITAQTCRQSGLSVAYLELLDYGGDEIYFKAEPTLAGKTFGETLNAYEDSCVIGLWNQKRGVVLNPSMDIQIEGNDELIVVAADDNTIHLSQKTATVLNRSIVQKAAPIPSSSDKILILGWNERASTIINELDNYVGSGSLVKVVAASREQVNGFASPNGHQYSNLSLDFEEGDITDRSTLERLAHENLQHVIVLSEATQEAVDVQHVDARTLITLLHLRDIVDKRGGDKRESDKPGKNGASSNYGDGFSIVSEMLDVRNRELAHVARADDFVVSDKLVSLLLAQISENKKLAAVFQDLFDPEGSELYFKEASSYVKMGQPVNFYTLVEAARQRGEVAVGYRLQALAFDADKAYGVKLNPLKSEMVTFGDEDRVIVLAES